MKNYAVGCLGLLVIWLALAIFIAVGTSSMVQKPVLYGFFMSSVLIVPIWLLWEFFSSLFGRKR